MIRVITVCTFIFSVLTISAQVQYEEVDKQALSDILKVIESRNKVSFAYEDQKIEEYLVSFKGGEYTLDQLLEEVFLHTTLSFEFVDDTHIAIYKPDLNERIICGYLYDDRTKLPIEYAAVSNDDFTNGVETNSEGYFEIATSEKDDHLSCTFLGYDPIVIPVTNFSFGKCKTYYLDQSSHLFETVLVTEYIDDGIGLLKDINNVVLKPEDMSMLPGQVERDVLSALEFLPGISSPTESFDGLSVRGGTPDQNLILWDDISVYQSSHMFGSIGGLNPFMVEGVEVYRNGVSSRYGGRVSSVIDISSKSEIPDNIDGGVGLNMTQLHMELAVPIGKKSAFFFSGRQSLTEGWNNSPTFVSYAEKLFQGSKIEVDSFSEIENAVRFSDVTAKWVYNPGRNKFTISLIGSLNNLEYKSALPQFEAFSVDILNQRHGGSKFGWERQWSDKVSSEFMFTNTDYSNEYDLSFRRVDEPDETPVSLDTDNTIVEGTFRMGVAWELAPHKKIRAGYQYTSDRINFDFITRNFGEQTDVSEIFNNRLNALYTDYSMTVPDLLELEVGLRYHYSSILKNAYFEPRISVSTDITDNLKLKLSTSKNFQFVSQLVVFDTNDLGLRNQIWVAANNTSVPVIEANQWTGGILYSKDGWTIDVEAYVKELAGITSLIDPSLNSEYSTGTSRISGIDVLVKRRFGKYRTWLSYSLSKANYEFLSISPVAFPTTFDQKRVIQWVHLFKKDRFEWSIGINAKSGLPYTRAIGIVEDEPDYGPLNGSQLPSYFRLDASMVYQLKKKKKYASYLAISFQNITNQKNTLARQYSILTNAANGEKELIVTDKLGLGLTPHVSLNFSF